VIKVNLLRSKVAGADGSQQVAATTQKLIPRDFGDPRVKDALVKASLISGFTIAVMIYESQNIRSLNDEAGRVQGQVQKLQADLNTKTAEVDKNKDVEVQSKELEDKLKILKLLSKLRLRQVKTLDFMQSSIPEKVWLDSITYSPDLAHFEGGHYQVDGHAVATEDLSDFVKRLDGSAYLRNVIVVKNAEVATKNSGVREFQFTADVENKN
jgi:Tfp pilus assembly protein PilN